MSLSIIHLGLDVHKDSIAIAVLPADAPAPIRVDRLPNDLPKLQRYLARLARGGDPPDLLRGERGRLRPLSGAAGAAPAHCAVALSRDRRGTGGRGPEGLARRVPTEEDSRRRHRWGEGPWLPPGSHRTEG
jgi:hypothetical protein